MLIACNIFEKVSKYSILVPCDLSKLIMRLTNVCMRNCVPIFSMGRRSLFPKASSPSSETHPKSLAMGNGRPLPKAYVVRVRN